LFSFHKILQSYTAETPASSEFSFTEPYDLPSGRRSSGEQNLSKRVYETFSCVERTRSLWHCGQQI